MKIFVLLLALGLCLADAVPGGYQQIDTTEAQADPTIQNYIQLGLQAVEQNAISKGYFNNSDFNLTQINSVYEQVVNGENYKFNCNFSDSNGVQLQANFTIYHSASTNSTIVSSYVYKVFYPAVTTTTVVTLPPTVTPTEGEVIESVAIEENGETVAVGESGETVAVAIEENAEAATTENTETAATEETSEAAPTENAETAATEETGEAAPETGESVTTTTTANATNTTSSANTTAIANTTTVDADGFASISAEDFAQSDDLQKLFTFGFETVVESGINAGKIPNTTFTKAKVLSAAQKDVKNGELYKFAAQGSNGDNVALELAFEVSYRVPSYSYKVVITTNSTANNTNTTAPVDTGAGSGSDNTTTPVDTNTTAPVDTGAGSDNTTAPVDTNTTTPVDTGAGSGNTTAPVNSTTPVDNTTAPATNTTTSQWVSVDVGQVQQSAELQSTLANGFNQVIQTVVDKNLLPADNYTVTQVVAISRLNLTNGADYNFTVKANNANQTLFLNMNFTAYYRYSNQSVKTVAYHYNYYTKAAPAPAQNTTTNTTSANNSTTINNNTSTNNSSSSSNNTSASNNTNTNNSTNNSSSSQSGYVALTADQIQAQDVQNAVNWGSNQVVQLGIQKGKIPSDTYNITQIASVLKKIQPVGANYNATVTLQSAANVTVSTNFNVYWNSTSNAMTLKAYSYGVTGIKKNNTSSGN